MHHKWLVTLPFILISLNVAGIAIFYEQIPDTLNAHYSLSWEVDRIEAKSIFTVFAPNVIQLVIVTLFISTRLWLRQLSKTSNSTIIDHFEERKKLSRESSLQILNEAALTFTLVFFFVQLSLIGAISPQYSVAFALGLSLFFIIITIIRSIQLSRKMKLLARDKQADRFWKAGLFYFNPDDPSLLVEKRYGLGWTINFARPLGWLIMIILLMIIVLVVVFG